MVPKHHVLQACLHAGRAVPARTTEPSAMLLRSYVGEETKGQMDQPIPGNLEYEKSRSTITYEKSDDLYIPFCKDTLCYRYRI